MKDIIALYCLRYGIEDTLKDIISGIYQACDEVSSMTTQGKHIYKQTATEISKVLYDTQQRLRNSE